ncbi:adenine phosphoribosyltransferase 1-like isoform X1 [Miscanthus floridulus]|uniref:adenine phosphoribosyltransferase 1-like isoform X1 n=1 Tax=Miscanthus floridulus TaxID=154761 RepID=UPI0034589F99
MGEEASCNAVSVMEAATNAKPAKENGCAPAVAEAAAEAVAAVVAPEAAAPVAAAAADPRLQGISDAIRVVPHFPKQGIMFNDITTLLLRPGVFKDAVDLFVERYRGMGIDAVAGIEARGFIFGPAIALAIGAKFIPLRKPRKLPGEVISEKYVLEYGTDCLEMHVGAIERPGERVLIVDDLVATGGTLCAGIRLLERAEADVVECACLIGLPKFKDFYKLNGKPVFVLVESRESDK